MNRILGESTVADKFMRSIKNKIPKASHKRISKINGHPHSLNKWVNIFFLAFILGLIIIAISFYFYTKSYADPNIHLSEPYRLIKILSIAQKVIVTLTLVTIIGLGMLWFYTHKFILVPLNYMRKATEQLINGKLDQTVQLNAPIEIKRLSDSINDLSVNVQEILLFVWNQAESSLHCIEKDKAENSIRDISTAEISILRHNLIELQRMVSSFALYDVYMDQKKVLGKSETD